MDSMTLQTEKSLRNSLQIVQHKFVSRNLRKWVKCLVNITLIMGDCLLKPMYRKSYKRNRGLAGKRKPQLKMIMVAAIENDYGRIPHLHHCR